MPYFTQPSFIMITWSSFFKKDERFVNLLSKNMTICNNLLGSIAFLKKLKLNTQAQKKQKPEIFSLFQLY